MTCHALYGLVVEADFGLGQPEVGRPPHGPDVVVHLGPTIAGFDDWPAGELVLEFVDHEGYPWYAIARRPDGSYHYRSPAVCDAVIGADLCHVEIRMRADVDPGYAPVMATGPLLSALLYLAGTPVLHASAVTRGRRTIAFMGRSGQGKSTMAALTCAGGGELVTDDVLPIVATDPVRVAVGSAEVRLRPGAKTLADELAARGRTTGTSADARNLVRLRSAAEQPGEVRTLDAIFVPWPNRDGRFELERLSAKDATVEVLRYPRLLGWKDPRVLATQLRAAAVLGAGTPVFRAHTPWGPPFRQDVAPALWDAVESAAARPAAVG